MSPVLTKLQQSYNSACSKVTKIHDWTETHAQAIKDYAESTLSSSEIQTLYKTYFEILGASFNAYLSSQSNPRTKIVKYTYKTYLPKSVSAKLPRYQDSSMSGTPTKGPGNVQARTASFESAESELDTDGLSDYSWEDSAFYANVMDRKHLVDTVSDYFWQYAKEMHNVAQVQQSYAVRDKFAMVPNEGSANYQSQGRGDVNHSAHAPSVDAKTLKLAFTKDDASTFIGSALTRSFRSILGKIPGKYSVQRSEGN
ncbi:hypothetical protein H4R33_000647 [Dimargaris cristalligena]|nr:hypothetical protein H4R33_000647 [Dimargaris cristalligena]